MKSNRKIVKIELKSGKNIGPFEMENDVFVKMVEDYKDFVTTGAAAVSSYDYYEEEPVSGFYDMDSQIEYHVVKRTLVINFNDIEFIS